MFARYNFICLILIPKKSEIMMLKRIELIISRTYSLVWPENNLIIGSSLMKLINVAHGPINLLNDPTWFLYLIYASFLLCEDTVICKSENVRQPTLISPFFVLEFNQLFHSFFSSFMAVINHRNRVLCGYEEWQPKG